MVVNILEVISVLDHDILPILFLVIDDLKHIFVREELQVVPNLRESFHNDFSELLEGLGPPVEALSLSLVDGFYPLAFVVVVLLAVAVL